MFFKFSRRPDPPDTAGQVAITNQNKKFDSPQHAMKSPADRGFEAHVAQQASKKREWH
ncbi:hypothetical protein [Herbaspirillum lusitanum]|uniref:hypothetical protein n=1 Tax=Herbaspirillum lusitanum TaxID=213312 RepID=UPI0002F19388|nr:hypothetical protein [Herbaspirillum lusitanum]